MKKKIVILMMFVAVLSMAACGKKERKATVEKTVGTRNQESSKKKESSTTEPKSESISESIPVKTEEEKAAEEIAKKTEAFNNLPLDVKLVLDASTIDDRANGMLGVVLQYAFVGDNGFLFKIHGGVSRFNPVYLVQYDNENIYPIGGKVSNRENTGLEDIGVNTSPVSKASLYDKYMSNKGNYEGKQVIGVGDLSGDYSGDSLKANKEKAEASASESKKQEEADEQKRIAENKRREKEEKERISREQKEFEEETRRVEESWSAESRSIEKEESRNRGNQNRNPYDHNWYD